MARAGIDLRLSPEVWGAMELELSFPRVTLPPYRGFALYNAANFKSIDLHRKAEEKSLAQLKRQ